MPDPPWSRPSPRGDGVEGPLRLARDGETFDGPVEFTIAKRAEPIAVVAPPLYQSVPPQAPHR